MNKYDMTRKAKEETNIITNILIYAYLSIILIPDIKAISFVYSSCSGLLILVLLWKTFVNFKDRKKYSDNRNYIIWLCFFSFYSLLSLYWSITPAANQISYFIINLMVLIPLSLYINSVDRLRAVLNSVVYSTITMTIFMFLFSDVSLAMSESSLRLSSSNSNWNANVIGMSCSISFIICMYFIVSKSKFKIIYFLGIGLFITIAVMTGSRKSIMILLLGYFFFTILKHARGKILYFFCSLTIVTIFIFIIFNVPILYDLIGVRFDSFLNYFTNKASSDSSTQYRMDMIEYGITWFKNKPLFGYGMDNFRYMYADATGKFAYAHNNYIELLVGGGVLGLLLYYGLSIKTINSLRKYIKNNRVLGAYLTTTLLTLIFIDSGLVSYNNRFIQIILCIIFCGANICKLNNGSKSKIQT